MLGSTSQRLALIIKLSNRRDATVQLVLRKRPPAENICFGRRSRTELIRRRRHTIGHNDNSIDTSLSTHPVKLKLRGIEVDPVPWTSLMVSLGWPGEDVCYGFEEEELYAEVSA